MITAEQVKALSDQFGISLTEAKIKLDKLALLQQINNAKTINDLKPVLLKIVDLIHWFI